jgi:hypothetical protein
MPATCVQPDSRPALRQSSLSVRLITIMTLRWLSQNRHRIALTHLVLKASTPPAVNRGAKGKVPFRMVVWVSGDPRSACGDGPPRQFLCPRACRLVEQCHAEPFGGQSTAPIGGADDASVRSPETLGRDPREWVGRRRCAHRVWTPFCGYRHRGGRAAIARRDVHHSVERTRR